MISDQEIETKAAEFKLRPLDVQKDYVYGWLLHGIARQPTLAQLILKGGNALRKGYLPDTRFSKDLDFSAQQAITLPALEKELQDVCQLASAKTGVQFIDKIAVREKDLPIPGVEALEARLYFKSFYGEENLTLRTQLDITQFDRIYLPVQNRQLLHPYSDAADCSATIHCQKLEEILASKLTSLLHRRNPADLFDLLYSTVFRNQFGVNRLEVLTTFLRKSIFEQQPAVARELLKSVPVPDFQGLWNSLVAPVASSFTFDFVVANFGGFIDSLFVLLPAPATVQALAPGNRGMAPGIAHPPPIGRPTFSSGFRNYFPSNIRNTIISAGRKRMMVELTYDGYRRLVEPYRLEYYVRKRDGQGLEYFWGWDTSGGKSAKIGIKQFICDKIQAVQMTTQQFYPRFVVEL